MDHRTRYNSLKLSLVAITSLGMVACTAGLHGHAIHTVAPMPTMVEPEAAMHASVDIEVQISFFGVPLAGANDVVFVLDRSGSMGLVSAGFAGRDVGMDSTTSTIASLGGSIVNKVAGKPLPSKLDAAKDELIRTLRAMPDGTRVGVIFFDNEINALAPRMWILSPDTRYRAEAFILGIKPGGSTAAVPAMDLAYRMGARRIVLLSDGLANTGGDGRDLMDRARYQIQRGLRIDTVGLGLDQDDGLLRSLAAESGGMAVTR